MNNPKIYYLLYTSLSNGLMPEASLTELLHQSRQKNAQLAITGMLLYMEAVFITKLEGRFIQLLEGDRTAVTLMYDRIVADDRNHHGLILGKGYYHLRCFPDWSMGFKVLDAQAYAQLPSFTEMKEPLFDRQLDTNPHPMLHYLKTFYDVNNRAY